MTKNDFSFLVEQYEKLVYTICYQLTKNHHTAQDLCQEAFLSAYLHMDSCPKENAKAWICCIATNKAKDFLKSAYNRRVTSGDSENMEKQHTNAMFIHTATPQDIVVAKEEKQVISEKINALKEPYQQVAVLHYLGQRSVNEIASRLGRPPRTVQTQLYRAKLQLRQNLSQLELVAAV